MDLKRLAERASEAGEQIKVRFECTIEVDPEDVLGWFDYEHETVEKANEFADETLSVYLEDKLRNDGSDQTDSRLTINGEEIYPSTDDKSEDKE
jgi:hypothetical protein